MTVWDELKVVLARLRDEQSGTLTVFPMPEVDEGREPPFAIVLAPWAAAAAEDLHQRFGDDVHLSVGALPYPPADRQQPTPPSGPAAGLLDPREVTAGLDGQAAVRSGHALHHGLLITNHTGQQFQIATNGMVTAVVVDPATGEAVGGYAGLETQALVRFQVLPGATQRIPLLIGTASFTPRLGYAIPPGIWGIQVTLEFDPWDPWYRRTPVLPLAVTD